MFAKTYGIMTTVIIPVYQAASAQPQKAAAHPRGRSASGHGIIKKHIFVFADGSFVPNWYDGRNGSAADKKKLPYKEEVYEERVIWFPARIHSGICRMYNRNRKCMEISVHLWRLWGSRIYFNLLVISIGPEV